MDCVQAWLKSPSCILIGEGPGYLPALSALARNGKISGGMVHDARIAAICLHHAVRELWTADRDFSRFEGLRVTNPLVAHQNG
ncbi:MAG: hypothetical protein HYU36_08230 [Planctomycetes bacterium]|nr:hypothetical protein [Planctomycetota bacterium]